MDATQNKLFNYLMVCMEAPGPAFTIVTRYALTADGMAALAALRQQFNAPSQSNRIQLHQHLNNIKQRDGEEPDAYILRVQHLISRITIAGDTISPTSVISSVLSGLLDSFEVAVLMINSQQKTWDARRRFSRSSVPR